MRTLKNNPKILVYSIILLTLALIYLQFHLLDFDLMRSDVLAYWNDSLEWRTPFHKFHVPFYPLLIAAFRGITFNTLPPIFYMIGINFVSLVIGIISIEKISSLLEMNNKEKLIPVLLLAFWPLAGIYAVIYPLADYVVIGLFLAGLALFLYEKQFPGAVLWGLAMITHKAIWPFIGIGTLIFVLQKIKSLRWKILPNIILILSPLAILWVLGAMYHGNILWIISSNLDVELSTLNGFPIFDGIIGSFLSNELSDNIKGLLILLIYIFTIAITILIIKKKQNFWQYGLIILIPLLILGAFINSYEIWAFMRFSRLLVIPIAIYIGGNQQIIKVVMNKPFIKIIAVVSLCLLIISQFVYAYYITLYFA